MTAVKNADKPEQLAVLAELGKVTDRLAGAQTDVETIYNERLALMEQARTLGITVREIASTVKLTDVAVTKALAKARKT